MFLQTNRTKSRKKSYHMYNYRIAAVEWKLLPHFLIIFGIEKDALILAKLPQYRLRYIILNVLSGHVIVIHSNIFFFSQYVFPICSQGAASVCSKNGLISQRASAMVLDFILDMASRYIKKSKSEKRQNTIIIIIIIIILLLSLCEKHDIEWVFLPWMFDVSHSR